MTRVYIITTNYNSRNHIDLVKLSLYSVFKSAEELRGDVKILLIDSASTDGSYEILRDLCEKLSEDMKIPFEAVRLNRDLGNSFALAYGFILAKKAGAKYVVTLDNDYVITRPSIIRELIDVFERLQSRSFHVYSIAPFSILESRDRLSEITSKCSEVSYSVLPKIYQEIIDSGDIDRSIVDSNIFYIDIFGRLIPVLRTLRYSHVKKILHGSNRKAFITPYVASYLAVYNANCAPIYPFTYIVGDDIVSGVEHLKAGYLNISIAELAGIHYHVSEAKLSSKRIYLSSRVVSIINSAPRKSAKILYLGVIHILFRLVHTLLTLVKLRRVFISMRLREGWDKRLVARSIDIDALKYSLLGAFKGLLNYSEYERMKEKWFSKYIAPREENLLNYVLINLSTWKAHENTLLALFKYIVADRYPSLRRDIFLFVRRVYHCSI